LPFGTPGSDVQTQAMLQVLLNLFVFGQGVQSAIESPRFATYSFPSSLAPFEYYPGRLAVEGRITEPVAAELARRGHQIQCWPDWIWTAGAVCAILADRRRGTLEAGADRHRRSRSSRPSAGSGFSSCACLALDQFLPRSRRVATPRKTP
jgi:gamma-glutamyltranspeptidase / glutathione hydrolase